MLRFDCICHPRVLEDARKEAEEGMREAQEFLEKLTEGAIATELAKILLDEEAGNQQVPIWECNGRAFSVVMWREGDDKKIRLVYNEFLTPDVGTTHGQLETEEWQAQYRLVQRARELGLEVPDPTCERLVKPEFTLTLEEMEAVAHSLKQRVRWENEKDNGQHQWAWCLPKEETLPAGVVRRDRHFRAQMRSGQEMTFYMGRRGMENECPVGNLEEMEGHAGEGIPDEVRRIAALLAPYVEELDKTVQARQDAEKLEQENQERERLKKLFGL